MSRSHPSAYTKTSLQKEKSSLCIQPNSLSIWAGRVHLQTACISYISKRAGLRKSSTQKQMVFQLLNNAPKVLEERSTHWSLLETLFQSILFLQKPLASVWNCCASLSIRNYQQWENMPFTGKSRGKFCVVKDFYISNTRDEEVSLTQLNFSEDSLIYDSLRTLFKTNGNHCSTFMSTAPIPVKSFHSWVLR